MSKRHLLITAVTALLTTVTPSSHAKITTQEVLTEGVSLSCISWKLVGTCIWLKCKLVVCSLNTSLLVRHYNPDAIVQVYRDPSDIPWSDMQFVLDISNEVAGVVTGGRKQSGSTQDSGYDKKQDLEVAKLTRRLVDVIGSPAVYPVGELLSGFGAGCSSPVTPFRPYYSSSLDYLSWRFPYADFLYPETFLLFTREVGYRKDGENKNLLMMGRWGNVYPRTGTVTHSDHYKASAVIAQRAANLVTEQTTSAHVVSYLGEKGDKPEMTYPKQAQEWSSEQAKWQMLSPHKDVGCAIFGEMKEGDNPADVVLREKSLRSNDGDYVWQLWRRYECCERKGQKLIMKVRFTL